MDRSKISTEWLKGLSEEEKESFKKTLLNSDFILDKLREILYNRCQEKESTKISDYDKASWSHYQAHKNGAIDELKTVINLITFE